MWQKVFQDIFGLVCFSIFIGARKKTLKIKVGILKKSDSAIFRPSEAPVLFVTIKPKTNFKR
jgi:hypothetical protein